MDAKLRTIRETLNTSVQMGQRHLPSARQQGVGSRVLFFQMGQRHLPKETQERERGSWHSCPEGSKTPTGQ
eukprot:11993945-Prorocentrum_lima.AAC.1